MDNVFLIQTEYAKTIDGINVKSLMQRYASRRKTTITLNQKKGRNMDIEKAIKAEMTRNNISYISNGASTVVKKKLHIPDEYEAFGLGNSSLFCMDNDEVVEWVDTEVNRWSTLSEWLEEKKIDLKRIKKTAAELEVYA